MAPTAPTGEDPRGVVFITRLTTPNKGNEALSGEWIKLLRAHLAGGALSLAPRLPEHLSQYRTAALGRPEQAAARFGGWAEAIAGKWSAAPPAPAPSVATDVVLDERPEPEDKPMRRLKTQLNIRGRLARLGAYRDDYMRRLSAFSAAGCVILNPAGEFWPPATDIPLRHLLDIYIARRIGCRAAIVNHTFELTDPRLLEVARLVYRAMDLVSVREEQSRARLVGLGVDPEKVIVSPDVVFMTEPAELPEPAQAAPTGIAVCPNRVMPNVVEYHERLIEALLAEGLTPVLVTNDFPYDQPALDHLSARYGLSTAGAGLSYRQYCRMLGGFDAVISSRLHTGVMALTAGTPIVPLEALHFKITAAMAGAGVPIPAIQPGEGDWVGDTLRSLRSILDDPASARAWVREVVERQRHGVDHFLGHVLEALDLEAGRAAEAGAGEAWTGSSQPQTA